MFLLKLVYTNWVFKYPQLYLFSICPPLHKHVSVMSRYIYYAVMNDDAKAAVWVIEAVVLRLFLCSMLTMLLFSFVCIGDQPSLGESPCLNAKSFLLLAEVGAATEPRCHWVLGGQKIALIIASPWLVKWHQTEWEAAYPTCVWFVPGLSTPVGVL